MGRSAIGDVRAGVKSAWAVGGPLGEVAPPASVYAGAVPAEPAPPYVRIRAEADGDPVYPAPAVPGQAYVQRVLLTVEVYVAGADGQAAADLLGPKVAAVQTAFGNEDWPIPDTVLLASFAGEPKEEAEKATYNGEPVWRADVPFRLTLQRTVR